MYVCVQELGLCVPLSPQAGPFASAGTEGGGVTVRIHECVCMCGCITYVGVKKCYIFTSCCLSLLIEAQQHCRIALAWPLSIPSLKRRALTLLGVREMLCCYTFQPLTPILPPRSPGTFDMLNLLLSSLSSSRLPSVTPAGFRTLTVQRPFGCSNSVNYYNKLAK